MNILKVDMVAFLMRTFEDYMGNASQVNMFKSNVDDLVKRNQIYPEVRNIIYQIYGIVNTDVFKPTVCQEKVYKINMYLSKSKMLGFNPNSEDLDKFKQSIDNDFKMGFINKQIKDILYSVFEFNKKEELRKNDTINVKDMDITILDRKTGSSNSKESKKEKLVIQLMSKGASQQVLNDICLFKEEYWDSLYYYYPNENYDGCSISSPYLHTALLKALKRPKGSVIKMYKKVADDGCHTTWAYVDVPKEAYVKPKIETPKGTGKWINACDPISSRSRIC